LRYDIIPLKVMPESGYKAPTEYLEIDHPWVSHQHAPIYEWTFPAEATDEELAAFVRAREEWATRAHYPVAWVVELSNITTANAKQRRVFAEHLKRFEEHDVQWNAGSALIVPSGWLRGLVTAVFWISPPKFPHQAFATRTDALEWAQMQLDAKMAEGGADSQARSRP
jgi:1,2-phenylacetyl-CoA epoxidase PaaB subunit